MPTTTSPFGPEFVKDLIVWFLQAINEATKKTYRMYWSFLISFLKEHWILTTAILILILVIAIIRAFGGYWGMLGSVLYNYLYFGILFMIGLINGSDVFASEYFEIICAIILYPICYFTVGRILDKLGVMRRF